MRCECGDQRAAAGRPGTGEACAGQYRTAAPRRRARPRVRRARPLTRKRHYPTEAVPAGPRARQQAEIVRVQLVQRVDQRRTPLTGATVERAARPLPRPVGGPAHHGRSPPCPRPQPHPSLLGAPARRPARHRDPRRLLQRAAPVPASVLGPPRRRPPRRRGRTSAATAAVRTSGAPGCDDHPPHPPRPLRRLRARRPWGRVAESPTTQAEPPPAPRPNPHPPTPEQAARIVTASWRDPGLGCAGLDGDDDRRPRS